ncbi:hypothetical protein JTB14_014491 [Gonioctena quinquepunctata]|nr:hypothetical protein JTB14_014491 [Gonioctena quinquepunctata]
MLGDHQMSVHSKKLVEPYSKYKIAKMNRILQFFLAVMAFSVAHASLDEKDIDQHLIPLFKKWHKQCIAITGAEEGILLTLKNGQFNDDDKTKRYTLCLWIVSEVIAPDGTLDEEKFLKYSPSILKEKALPLFKKCRKEAEETGAKELYEIMWLRAKCTYNTTSKEYDFLLKELLSKE